MQKQSETNGSGISGLRGNTILDTKLNFYASSLWWKRSLCIDNWPTEDEYVCVTTKNTCERTHAIVRLFFHFINMSAWIEIESFQGAQLSAVHYYEERNLLFYYLLIRQ